MKILADLHFHSKYSRAVSPKMEIETISKWANQKGLNLITTADFTPPDWFNDLSRKLVKSRPGVYHFKNKKKLKFLVTTELSFIYDQYRIHMLAFAPNLETAGEINQLLTQNKFNLKSDGRPILGISPKKFIKMTQKISSNIFYLPAHIWSPWYSLFGSKSGYNSIEECFGKTSKQITAVESGLSSDPLMNWQVKELDKRVITSFSDAHSPSKLGREITIFNLPKNFSYTDVITALQTKNDPKRKVKMTIEFYPEEGKYYFTGHRKCHVYHSPKKTKKVGKTCPVCGKPLTLGVSHQVSKFSRQTKIEPKFKLTNGLKLICHPKNIHPPYIRLIPLQEIISEIEGVGVKTKTVNKKYEQAIKYFDNEINLLTKAPLKKISAKLGDQLAQGIKRNRLGEIKISPGYDGLYGEVKIWQNEKERFQTQKSLF